MIKIKDIKGREILDSRGNPTVEADITLDDGTVARAAAGKESDSIEKAAGVALDSPTPTPILAAASCPKLWASPETAVIALQKASPSEINVRRVQTSARRPSGMPNTA